MPREVKSLMVKSNPYWLGAPPLADEIVLNAYSMFSRPSVDLTKRSCDALFDAATEYDGLFPGEPIGLACKDEHSSLVPDEANDDSTHDEYRRGSETTRKHKDETHQNQEYPNSK